MKCSCTSFKKKLILIFLSLMALQLIRSEVIAMSGHYTTPAKIQGFSVLKPSIGAGEGNRTLV